MNRDCKKDAAYSASARKFANGGMVTTGIASGVVIKGPGGSEGRVSYSKSGPSKEAGTHNLWKNGFADGGGVSDAEVKRARQVGDEAMKTADTHAATYKTKQYEAPTAESQATKKADQEAKFKAQMKFANGGKAKPKAVAVKITAKPKPFANGGKVKKFADGGIEGESSSSWVQDEQAKLAQANKMERMAAERAAAPSPGQGDSDLASAQAALPSAAAQTPSQSDQDLANAASAMRATPVSAIEYPDFGEDAPSKSIAVTPAAKAGAAAGKAAALADQYPDRVDRIKAQERTKGALQAIGSAAATAAHGSQRAAAAGRGEDPNKVRKSSDVPAMPTPGSLGPNMKVSNPEKERYAARQAKADADWESVKGVGSKIAALTDLRPAGNAIYSALSGAGKAIKGGAAKLANKSMGMKVYSEGDDEEKKG